MFWMSLLRGEQAERVHSTEKTRGNGETTMNSLVTTATMTDDQCREQLSLALSKCDQAELARAGTLAEYIMRLRESHRVERMVVTGAGAVGIKL